MSSYEIERLYEVLLKRYEEHGFLRPEGALESNIQSLMMKGRTREEAILELNSSDSPWTYSPPEQPTVSKREESEQQKAVLGQIANLREKIDSLTTLFSKGEITEETYLRGVRKIEDDISRLQQEHKIPKVEQRRTPISISGTPRRKTIEELEETAPSWAERGEPSGLWYLVPFFFGILGGIIAYVAVKNDDPEMADNLLIFGILWTLVPAFILWLLLLH